MFACTYFDCTLLQQDTCKFGQVNHKIQDQNGHTKVNILFALMIFIMVYDSFTHFRSEDKTKPSI